MTENRSCFALFLALATVISPFGGHRDPTLPGTGD